MGRWAESGLSRAEFAERAGVHHKTFCNQSRRVQRERSATTAALVPFIEVHPGDAVAGMPVGTAQPLVLMDAQVRVEIPTGFDTNTLSRVLDLLEARR